MAQGILAQKIQQTRCCGNHRLQGRIFGVENTQWVTVQSAARVLIEQLSMLLEILNQGPTMLQPLGRLAQAVDFKPQITQTEVLPQRHCQQDKFCINLCSTEAQCLSANLVKLPVAPPLRTLMPEHRADVVEPFATIVEHGMLHHGAHHASRALWAQCQGVTIEPVLKGVHLFFDDVCDLTESAGEQLRVLDNRRADVAVGVAGHQASHPGL